MSRLAITFARLRQEGELGLFPYLMVGYPSVDSTLELVPAMVEAGADAFELGVPFSDPLADGVAIQRAGFHALSQGVTLETILQVCGVLRQRVSVPLLIMSYYNLLLAHGLERFASDATHAGADGVIVPDLPPEEAGPLEDTCHREGLDLIMMLAPTSSEERISRIVDRASGFLYCVSLTGVTGARDQLSEALPSFLQTVRGHSDLPLAVGFGISKREHMTAVAPHVDAAIVGSALVELIERTPPSERVSEASDFISRLKGRTLERPAPAGSGSPSRP